MPKTLLCVFNNCVGQNKSQLIMMFFAMLSVIPGHSHNRVVAWCRNAINEEQKPLHTNGYRQYCQQNQVHCNHSHRSLSLSSTFLYWLGHHSTQILQKFAQPLHIRLFFESDEGHLSMRHLSSTPDIDVAHIQLIKQNFEIIRTSILRDLFGSKVDIVEVAVNKSLRIRLPTIDIYDMLSKKLASLLKKYFSIPSEYMAYYRAVPIGFTEQSNLVLLKPTCSKKIQIEAITMMVIDDLVVVPPKVKVGRPKKNMMIVDVKSFGQKSILAFLNKRSQALVA